ncbi:MAG: hypothetical protein HYY51_03520 [Candidatus Magasanikbacteria bacterium]|nr:hypothetical protein [Candidatus Magasanikbacteria bacterium]
MFLLALRRLAFDVLIDFFRFPVWWFGGGLKRSFLFCLDLFKVANAYLAPGLWLANIFVPMYGQRDIQGRITSFFVRLVNVIFRSLLLFCWALLCLSIFVLWIFILPFVCYMFIISLW